jgi:hypothetical protein
MKKQLLIIGILLASTFISLAQESTLTATLVNRKYGFGYPSLTKKDNLGYPLIETLAIPAIYEAVTNMHFKSEYENLVGVIIDDKWGYIDATGTTKIPFKYEEVSYFNEGLAPVKLNGKWGYINKTGATVIPFKYDYAVNFFDGLAQVELAGKVGFINKTGVAIVPIKYDKQTDANYKDCIHCGPLYSFQDGKATVVLDGKCGNVDAKGNYTPCKEEDLETTTITGTVNGKGGIWVKGNCQTNRDIRSVTLNDKAVGMATNYDNQTMFQGLSEYKTGEKVTLKIVHTKQCTYLLSGTYPQGIAVGADQEKLVEKVNKPVPQGLDSTTFSGKVKVDYAIGFFESESKGYDDIKKVYLNDKDITLQLNSGARKVITFAVLKYKKGDKVTLKFIHKKGVVVKQLDPKVVD